ncbi:MAG: MBL fold metallo-hydrolase [Deltaproteobacteria bacterium]|nr:MBL fold metallo-hydrolase [Deltaproteobacteria bacterium]
MTSVIPTRFCVLASGSNGNCTLVEHGEQRLLIDIGIGPRVLTRRLGEIGLNVSDLSHVLLTHEHGDHIRGLDALLARQPKLTIHCGPGTAKFLGESTVGHIEIVRPDRDMAVGPMQISTFAVSHDAASPLGFRIETPAATLAYATDLGTYDDAVLRHLDGADALILEANHDATMLRNGPYASFLKTRIAGPKGHLSNDQSMALLAQVLHSRLRHVIFAHRSAVNNSDEAIDKSLETSGLASESFTWQVASRRGPLPPVTLDATPHGPPSDDGPAPNGNDERPENGATSLPQEIQTMLPFPTNLAW